MRSKSLLAAAALLLALAAAACGPYASTPEPTRRPTITPSPEAPVEVTAEATSAP